MKLRTSICETLHFRDGLESMKEVEKPDIDKNYEFSDIHSYYAIIHRILDDMERKGFDLSECNMFFDNDSMQEKRNSKDSQIICMFTQHDKFLEFREKYSK